MPDEPRIFAIQDRETQRIGVAWMPDEEAGGCKVVQWVPEEMIEEAYAAILARRHDLTTTDE